MDQFENAQRQRQPTSTIGLADSVGRDLRYSFRSLERSVIDVEAPEGGDEFQ